MTWHERFTGLILIGLLLLGVLIGYQSQIHVWNRRRRGRRMVARMGRERSPW